MSRRTTYACDVCRKHHLKCSRGTDQVCARCLKKNVNCTWTKKKTRLLKKDARVQVAVLALIELSS